MHDLLWCEQSECNCVISDIVVKHPVKANALLRIQTYNLPLKQMIVFKCYEFNNFDIKRYAYYSTYVAFK